MHKQALSVYYNRRLFKIMYLSLLPILTRVLHKENIPKRFNNRLFCYFSVELGQIHIAVYNNNPEFLRSFNILLPGEIYSTRSSVAWIIMYFDLYVYTYTKLHTSHTEGNVRTGNMSGVSVSTNEVSAGSAANARHV